MFRSESYDEMFSNQLQEDPDLVREFILITMKEDNVSLIEALKEMIERMGVTEFANLIGCHRSSVSRFISSDETPKLDTLNKYLAPFKLKVKLDIEDIAS